MAKGGKGGGSIGGGAVGPVGGKVGGAKGGGGKGGKGKQGGGCPSGQVTVCFDKPVYQLIKAAFDGAIESTASSDGCDPGFMRVCLDMLTAQQLWVAVALKSGAVSKKKKTKGGLSPRLVARTKGGKNPAVSSSPSP